MLANWVEAVPVPIQGGQIAELQGGGPTSLDEQGDGELRGEPNLEEHPDPDESPGGVEGGGLSAQEEMPTAGPVTRSKAKKMRKQ